MSVYYYDDSLLYKFKNVFSNTVLSPTDRAFERASMLPHNNGNVSFPLISIDRENYSINMSFFNEFAKRRGERARYLNEGKSLQMERSIPLRIDYQIDLWAKDRRTLDKLMEEILFWITDTPQVEVISPIVKLIETPEKLSTGVYLYELDDEEGHDKKYYSYHKHLNVVTHKDNYAIRPEPPNCLKVSQSEWDDAIDYIKEEEIDLSGYNEITWEDMVEIIETLEIPTHKYTLVIDQDLQDNSDIMSFDDLGRIYRMTFPFYIENARLTQHDEVPTVLEIETEISLL